MLQKKQGLLKRINVLPKGYIIAHPTLTNPEKFVSDYGSKVADVVEKYNLMWLEIDMYQPDALRELKDSINIPICSGENLLFMQEYLPYFPEISSII